MFYLKVWAKINTHSLNVVTPLKHCCGHKLLSITPEQNWVGWNFLQS